MNEDIRKGSGWRSRVELKRSGENKAILAEENIGLMLPCNVIVYEKGDRTVLSVIKPTVAMKMIDNRELDAIAEFIEVKLKKAFDAIE